MIKKLLCKLLFHQTSYVTFTERLEDGYIQEYAQHKCLCGKHNIELPVGDNVRF